MFHKALSFVALLVAASCTCSQRVMAPRDSESNWGIFVEPARFYNAQDDAYYEVVRHVFSETEGFSGGCFNMVSLTEDSVEEMVYAECSVQSSKAKAAVVHVVATESIAQKLKTLGPEAARNVKARRTEAVLDAEDSQLLRDLWIKVLNRAAVEKGSRVREIRRDYFFSSFRQGLFQGRIGGVARNPAASTPAANLIGLAAGLAQVADSSEEQRTRAVTSLKAKTIELSRLIGMKDR